MHLVARFLHVGSAILWVGYLAFVAWVLLPASTDKGGHAPNLGPILQRLRGMRWLGPFVFLAGLWLVTASGHGFADLMEPGWGHAISGGIVLAVAMIGLEHSLVLPRVEAAHQGPAEERDEELSTAQTAASVAAALGLVAAFLMVLALLGGF